MQRKERKGDLCKGKKRVAGMERVGMLCKRKWNRKEWKGKERKGKKGTQS